MKKLTAEQAKAIDWASLFAQVGPIVATLIQAILQQILSKQQALKASGNAACPEALKTACADECDALAELVARHCVLHGLICPDDNC